VQWIVVEQVDDGGARLVALRLSDGARRLLFATEQPLPLHASVHPKAARVAVDVPSRGTQGGRPRTRVGLLNLERPGMGWLRQSLDPKWRVGHATFDDTGTRLALEGAWDGVPISDIYAYSVSFSGNSVREEPLGGAGNPARLGCRQVRFLEGGKQLIYLRKTQLEGGYEVCLLDLDRDGESAALLEGRAPSRLTLTLTEGAEAVPEVSMAWCGAIKQVFWVGLARGGTRQQVRTARVGVRPHTDLGPSHLRIEEICVARGGELLACSADGQVWLTDVESGASVAIVDGKQGVSHRGLCFDEAQGRLLFCTNDGQGSRLRALDLGTRSVRDLHTLGTASVVGLIALADEPEIAARMEGFVSVAEPAPPADDATAIQRVPPVGDEAEAPQLITEEIEAPPEDPTIELASAALEAALAAAPQPTPEPEPTPEPTPAPDPAVDFARWMKHIGTLDDPTKALTGLEKLRENSTLREAARLWLGTQRRRATGKEEVPVALLHALVAAGHLHLNEARGDLLELCRRGRPRVQDGGLLETDEHFALAALLYIDGHSTRFGWTKVYRDYEGMLVKINEVLEGEGEGPAARIMAAFAEGYERQIAGVLKAPDPTAVPGLDPKRLRESLAEMTAHAAVEASTRQVEDAPAAEEAEDQEALEAARLAEEARLAQAALQAEEDARRAEEEEEEIRALARRQAEEAERRAAERAAEEARREQARKAEEEARIEARRRAAIEAEKRKAEEDRLWHEQRRRAEQEAQQKAEEERLWQEQRRRAEQEAQQAEEERLWQEQRRRAEEARRPADASRRAVAKQSEPAERPASAAKDEATQIHSLFRLRMPGRNSAAAPRPRPRPKRARPKRRGRPSACAPKRPLARKRTKSAGPPSAPPIAPAPRPPPRSPPPSGPPPRPKPRWPPPRPPIACTSRSRSAPPGDPAWRSARRAARRGWRSARRAARRAWWRSGRAAPECGGGAALPAPAECGGGAPVAAPAAALRRAPGGGRLPGGRLPGTHGARGRPRRDRRRSAHHRHLRHRGEPGPARGRRPGRPTPHPAHRRPLRRRQRPGRRGAGGHPPGGPAPRAGRPLAGGRWIPLRRSPLGLALGLGYLCLERHLPDFPGLSAPPRVALRQPPCGVGGGGHRHGGRAAAPQYPEALRQGTPPILTAAAKSVAGGTGVVQGRDRRSLPSRLRDPEAADPCTLQSANIRL
jgi:hypothetical protein